MKIFSLFQILAAASISLALSVSSAQTTSDESNLSQPQELSGIGDIIGGLIGGGNGNNNGRGDQPGRGNQAGRPPYGYVVRSIQVRAEKLGSSSQTIGVRATASSVRLTALQNAVSFRGNFEIFPQNQYPLSYQLYDLRQGESVVLNLSQDPYNYYPMNVDSVRLEITSPNLIGSRGVLLMEFIQ